MSAPPPVARARRPLPPAYVRPADSRSHGAVFHDSPYAIRISEFGIPESGIGVQRFLRSSKDSPLTRKIMVR